MTGPASNLETTHALLARIRDGDNGARDRLVRRFLPGLSRWAHGRLPDYARDLMETNDLVQVTLMRALSRIDEFEPGREGAFLAYLHRILLNCLRDEVRRATRAGRTSLSPPPSEGRAPSDGSTPPSFDLPEERSTLLERTLGAGTVAAYERALASLTPEQQEAVVLRIEFGFSYPEVAEALGRPSGNSVRMQVTRALARLAEAMESEL